MPNDALNSSSSGEEYDVGLDGVGVDAVDPEIFQDPLEDIGQLFCENAVEVQNAVVENAVEVGNAVEVEEAVAGDANGSIKEEAIDLAMQDVSLDESNGSDCIVTAEYLYYEYDEAIDNEDTN